MDLSNTGNNIQIIIHFYELTLLKISMIYLESVYWSFWLILKAEFNNDNGAGLRKLPILLDNWLDEWTTISANQVICLKFLDIFAKI